MYVHMYLLYELNYKYINPHYECAYVYVCMYVCMCVYVWTCPLTQMHAMAMSTP